MVAKEKGTQIIQHFLNTHNVDTLMQEVTSTPSDQLDPETLAKIDFVCDEISNFSYLHQTYCYFASNLLARQCDDQ